MESKSSRGAQAALATVGDVCTWASGCGLDEEVDDVNVVYFKDRDGPSDEPPPAHLVQRFKALAREAKQQFPNAEVEIDVVDEWISLTLTLHDRILPVKPRWTGIDAFYARVAEQMLSAGVIPRPSSVWPHRGSVVVSPSPEPGRSRSFEVYARLEGNQVDGWKGLLSVGRHEVEVADSDALDAAFESIRAASDNFKDVGKITYVLGLQSHRSIWLEADTFTSKKWTEDPRQARKHGSVDAVNAYLAVGLSRILASIPDYLRRTPAMGAEDLTVYRHRDGFPLEAVSHLEANEHDSPPTMSM
jgi:hypothetical protein